MVTLRTCVATLIALVPIATSAGEGEGRDFARRHAALRGEHLRNLAELARWCTESGLSEQMHRALEHVTPYRAVGQVLLLPGEASVGEASRTPIARGSNSKDRRGAGQGSQPQSDRDTPAAVNGPGPKADSRVVADHAPKNDDSNTPPASRDESDLDDHWRSRFWAARRAQARRVFDLARQAAETGERGLAWRLVHEVLYEDPNHAQARKILGYEFYEGRWLSAFEISKARSGQRWHERFGWLPAEHVARYEAGERYYKGRWMSDEEERRQRGTLSRGWFVNSEHYAVHTDESLEAAVSLAVRLERFYDVWRQLFIEFYSPPAQFKRWFETGMLPSASPRRHKVTFYRNKDEYVSALVDGEPNIAITTGYYRGDDKTVHYFAQPGMDDSNLFHEATHQLFSETRKVIRRIGDEQNFWLVEGVACYMESLVLEDAWCLVGGTTAGRIMDAHYRLLTDDFYVPLSDFVELGMREFQTDERIRKLYSQASGLAWFLMAADNEAGTRTVVDYLTAVYTGRDTPQTLSDLAGADFVELDRRYRAYLETIGPPQPRLDGSVEESPGQGPVDQGTRKPPRQPQDSTAQ